MACGRLITADAANHHKIRVDTTTVRLSDKRVCNEELCLGVVYGKTDQGC